MSQIKNAVGVGVGLVVFVVGLVVLVAALTGCDNGTAPAPVTQTAVAPTAVIVR